MSDNQELQHHLTWAAAAADSLRAKTADAPDPETAFAIEARKIAIRHRHKMRDFRNMSAEFARYEDGATAAAHAAQIAEEHKICARWWRNAIGEDMWNKLSTTTPHNKDNSP